MKGVLGAIGMRAMKREKEEGEASKQRGPERQWGDHCRLLLRRRFAVSADVEDLWLWVSQGGVGAAAAVGAAVAVAVGARLVFAAVGGVLSGQWLGPQRSELDSEEMQWSPEDCLVAVAAIAAADVLEAVAAAADAVVSKESFAVVVADFVAADAMLVEVCAVQRSRWHGLNLSAVLSALLAHSCKGSWLSWRITHAAVAAVAAVVGP